MKSQYYKTLQIRNLGQAIKQLDAKDFNWMGNFQPTRFSFETDQVSQIFAPKFKISRQKFKLAKHSTLIGRKKQSRDWQQPTTLLDIEKGFIRDIK